MERINPKISIIVPIYNSEQFLSRCVDSILKQTVTDFELLLIDDGSPDKSGIICDEYASKDNRIRVLHKENGGVSTARNIGLDSALGEYICFVDSDDFLEKNYLEVLLKNSLENNAEMIVCSYFSHSAREISYCNMKTSIIDHCNENWKTADLISSSFMYYPWNKLFLRKILEKNNIRFDETIKFSEDLIFNCNYIVYCQTIVTLSEELYHYNQENLQNASSKYFPLYFKYLIARFISQEEAINKLKIENCIKDSKIFTLALFNFKRISDYYLFKKIDVKDVVEIYNKSYKFFYPYFERMITTGNKPDKVNYEPDLLKWYNKYLPYLKEWDSKRYYKAIYKHKVLRYELGGIKRILRRMMKP
ncbi:MAG: glycosyltransferase family 2 protein [Acutalibacteraceae bacterium]